MYTAVFSSWFGMSCGHFLCPPALFWILCPPPSCPPFFCLPSCPFLPSCPPRRAKVPISVIHTSRFNETFATILISDSKFQPKVWVLLMLILSTYLCWFFCVIAPLFHLDFGSICLVLSVASTMIFGLSALSHLAG